MSLQRNFCTQMQTSLQMSQGTCPCRTLCNYRLLRHSQHYIGSPAKRLQARLHGTIMGQDGPILRALSYGQFSPPD